MREPPHSLRLAAADFRWSWLPWSTRRLAWCAPWMLHQGREPALERAASRRSSAQGERLLRRGLFAQQHGATRSSRLRTICKSSSHLYRTQRQ